MGALRKRTVSLPCWRGRSDDDREGQITNNEPLIRSESPKIARDSRPRIVTDTAILVFVVAAFHAVFALTQLARASIHLSDQGAPYALVSSHHLESAVIDIAIAVLSTIIAVGILRGWTAAYFASWIGLLLSAMWWIYFTPFIPWLAIPYLLLDIAAVIGLIESFDYCTPGVLA